jgi:hypothetical protein
MPVHRCGGIEVEMRRIKNSGRAIDQKFAKSFDKLLRSIVSACNYTDARIFLSSTMERKFIAEHFAVDDQEILDASHSLASRFRCDVDMTSLGRHGLASTPPTRIR